MSFPGRLLSIPLRLLPVSNKQLYRLCRYCVDRYNGDNNANIHTNGELHFMHRMVPGCHTVFDVGANIGEWATLALDINSSLDLHCFEPSHSTYQQLLAKSLPPNVTCNNLAFGSRQEEKTLYVFQEFSTMNSLYQRQGLEDGWGIAPPQHTERIWLDTIDHYCWERGIRTIDFLKVDVEGHELEVFIGAREMLSKGQIRYVQFEYGGCYIDARVLLKDVFEFFQSLGYALYKIYPQSIRLIGRYDQRLENFQYQNWIAMRAH